MRELGDLFYFEKKEDHLMRFGEGMGRCSRPGLRSM